MNKLMLKENIKIEEMIFEVRGKQVILSSDVAKLYKTETRIINQTIKRNIMREVSWNILFSINGRRGN